MTARQLPPGTHPKCRRDGCDRYKCVDECGPALPHHGKKGTQGRSEGGDYCCRGCRNGGPHDAFCHPIMKSEELARLGVPPEKRAALEAESNLAATAATAATARPERPPPAPPQRAPLQLPPGIKACPACGMLVEKVGGDDQMMCGCEARVAGGTYAKALAAGGCGHEWNWGTLAPLGTGRYGAPANDRQVLFQV